MVQAIRSTVSGVIPSSGVTLKTIIDRFSGAFLNLDTIIDVSKSEPIVLTLKSQTMSAIAAISCLIAGVIVSLETVTNNIPR